VLTVKKNMHLILNSSTCSGTLVKVANSTAPDGVMSLSRGFMSVMSHTFLILNLRSAVKSE